MWTQVGHTDRLQNQDVWVNRITEWQTDDATDDTTSSFDKRSMG